MSRQAVRARSGQGEARRRLVAAARSVFARRGVDGARTRDLADAAGVDQKLIGYYFAGKEGLYREVLADATDALARELADALSAADADPAQRLQGVLEAVLRVTNEQPDLARLAVRDLLEGDAVLTRTVAEIIGPALQPLLARFEADVRAGLVRDIPPPYVVMVIVMAAVMPAVVPGAADLVLAGDATPERQARVLAELLGHGLLTDPDDRPTARAMSLTAPRGLGGS